MECTVSLVYIETLTTNAKSPTGQPQTWTLGPKTLIVGPNEAGKSAIAQSAQVIAEGGAAGLLLRKGLVKQPVQLLTMAPSGSALRVSARLNTGEEIEWTAEPGKKPRVTGAHNIGVGVESVRAAFSGSPDTARRFLAETIPLNAISLADLRKMIPEPFQGKFEQIAANLSSMVGFEELFKLVEEADAQKKAAKSAVEKAETATNALGVGIVPGSSEKLDQHFNQMKLAILADFFRRVGPPAKAAHDDGDGAPLAAVRWLAAQIGGKEALSAALPLDTARSDFMDLSGSIYAEKLAEATRARAAQGGIAVDAWTRFSALLNDTANALTDTVLIAEFERRVNAYLPESDAFVLDRTGLYPGLMRNGRVHTALSGSTEARVLAAMTAALAVPGKLNVLVVDDRMWDGMTLARTLRALQDAPCQVILMSTMLPRGRRRQSWTTIELEARYDYAETSDTDNGE